METDRSNQWEQVKQGAIEEIKKLIDFEARHGLVDQIIAITGDKQFTAQEMLEAIEKEDEYGKELIQMYQMRKERMSESFNESRQNSLPSESSTGNSDGRNSSSQDDKKESSIDPNLLLISPTNDPPSSTYVTSFSHPASDVARDAAKNNSRVSWSTKRLDAKDANQANVDMALKGNVNFVLHYGHGRHDAIIGQNDQPVIDTNTQAALLSGKALSTVSCSSANPTLGLGPDAIKKGARAYLGYSLPFWEPGQANLIDIFIEAANAANVALLDGETFLDAYNGGITTYKLKYDELMQMAAKAPNLGQCLIILWAASFLLWDMHCFTRLGDPDTKAF